MTTPAEDLPRAGGPAELPPPPPPPEDALPPPPPAVRRKGRVPYTRIGAAWLGVWTGVPVVILLIIFIGQNTDPVRVNFLWLDGQIPIALALLVAGVGGAVIAMAVAAARIVQLRRLVRRGRD